MSEFCARLNQAMMSLRILVRAETVVMFCFGDLFFGDCVIRTKNGTDYADLFFVCRLAFVAP
jgi:hypothetical protein